MSVQGVAAGSVLSSLSTVGRFSLPGAAEFSRTLNLGQIIKGRVLLQYEGNQSNRYLVNFDGHDRVVDSAIPLSTGELIHGRVAALGDHVELQRVYPEKEPSNEVPAQESQVRSGMERFAGQREQWLEDLLTRFQTSLTTEDKATLNQVARSVNDPSTLGMVGVALSKLGLQQTPELLMGMYSLLKRTGVFASSDFSANASSSAGSVAAQAVGVPLASLGQLADVLTKTIGQSASEPEEAKASAPVTGDAALPNVALAIQPRVVKQISDDDSEEHAQQSVWRVVNAQADGTVAHRVGTLPLLLGDQLVEVSVALFEQKQDSEKQPEAKHRQIVFALSTDSLGAVEMKARLSGERVCIRVTAEDETKAQQLAGYTKELRAMLAQGGWQVDEIVYESRETDGRNAAVASVIEHIALQDSLSQLV